MTFTSAYKAAAVQMNSGTDLEKNFDQAEHFIREAAGDGARVAGLPENFAFLGGLSMRMEQADTIAGKAADFLSKMAREYSIYLLGGSYPVPGDDGKVFNHSSLYNPKGEKVAGYDKIHLFDVSLSEEEAYRESDYVLPGPAQPVAWSDEHIGSWGLSVCYDLRFPEYYRLLIEQGAEVLTVPSAFTRTTGRDHWRSLLRARAIENTAYVFAPAQTGRHGNDRQTWGHAMIVDPWGQVLVDAGTEPGVALAEIDPVRLSEVRQAIPSLTHRRL